MKGFQIRYTPDSRLGKAYPRMRYPWRTEAFPSREVAEDVRQACANAESMEVVEVEE